MIICDHKVALGKFWVIWLRLLILIDFYLTIKKFIYKKGKAHVPYVQEATLTNSTILTFSVTRQNIIRKKYQTDLSITLIGNGVHLKAAFSKCLHWKIPQYVREVVTIHRNLNHENICWSYIFRFNDFLLCQFAT